MNRLTIATRPLTALHTSFQFTLTLTRHRLNVKLLTPGQTASTRVANTRILRQARSTRSLDTLRRTTLVHAVAHALRIVALGISLTSKAFKPSRRHLTLITTPFIDITITKNKFCQKPSKNSLQKPTCIGHQALICSLCHNTDLCRFWCPDRHRTARQDRCDGCRRRTDSPL